MAKIQGLKGSGDELMFVLVSRYGTKSGKAKAIKFGGWEGFGRVI